MLGKIISSLGLKALHNSMDPMEIIFTIRFVANKKKTTQINYNQFFRNLIQNSDYSQKRKVFFGLTQKRKVETYFFLYFYSYTIYKFSYNYIYQLQLLHII